MNIIQNSKLALKALALVKAAAPGAILVAMLQAPISPVLSPSVLPLKTATALAEQVTPSEDTQVITSAFLGNDLTDDETHTIVDDQVAFVSSRDAYPASLAVVKKFENVIKAKADENNVPEDVAIGVALLENGGSETAVSPAGALGVFQLMPGTARSLGLKVTKSVDERKNPEMNIEAGVSYLASNYAMLGDWGLATWAYHAGEGNVAKALKIYAKSNDGITLKGLKDTAELKKYVQENGITVHKLLSDPAVQKFTEKLNDDSSGYPYKVLATAKLFKKSKGLSNQVTVR
jgi:soluble lytic murein transglycosylase-like protein